MPQCILCPVGTYQPSKGTTQCIKCSQYSTTLSTGNKNTSSCICMLIPILCI